MVTTLNPYLSFRGNAKDAMQFYQSVLGGDLTWLTFADAMPQGVPADEQDKLMHAQLIVPSRFVLMGSDTPMSMPFETGSNICIAVSGADEDGLTGFYEAFATAGTVVEPLAKAPWGDSFGMVDDQFGVRWMFNIGGSPI